MYYVDLFSLRPFAAAAAAKQVAVPLWDAPHLSLEQNHTCCCTV
jgi:hypothetical protein